MRRLAKQTRNDKVRSNKDYQELHQRSGATFIVDAKDGGVIVFQAGSEATGNVPFIGIGGYISSGSEARVDVLVRLPNGVTKLIEVEARTYWSRFGAAFECEKAGTTSVEFRIRPGTETISLWGLSLAPLNLPDKVIEGGGDTLKSLNSKLLPEGMFLPHQTALDADPNEDGWSGVRYKEDDGVLITLKKCAYCQRLLPIDPQRPSALAFHKHNSKKSGHQNECRACKKWRINDNFNPKRTTDQLHESSVITRERKLFLRDPEILQAIKDREGAGLKSIVWKRFGKKCFCCGKPIKLGEVQLDHTRPMAYLWPIDNYATCLCAECNNHKKDRFPIDFYSDEKLHQLSEITGLSYDELIKKNVNDAELNRILADIETFAKQWDARTFNATSRKIRELRADVDLFAVLKEKNVGLHDAVLKSLAERPEEEEEVVTSEK